MQPEIIKGGLFTDTRGTLSFVNDFEFSNIKRFYTIRHASTSLVRAWQGHKIEHKYFYVSSGSFVIGWVKIDDWKNPSTDLTASHVVLSAELPCILSIPAGYANGIKALEDNATLIIFSDCTLEESTNDRWSFDQQLWLNWQQF